MGGTIMLKKFTVKNFKNFKETLVLDFTKARDYEFNQNLIKNNLINKMLVYGPNNSGKSNLGAAIMDITTHLTDNNGLNNSMYDNYLNGNCTKNEVEFIYEFLFNGKNITYKYIKNNNRKLICEELYESEKLLFEYNYINNNYENNIPEASTIVLNRDGKTNISILKYIYANTLIWEDDSSIPLLMEYANNMLWFRSLRQNEFIGVMPNGENLNDYIINNRLLGDFQKFLKNCGQNYSLCELNEFDKKVIGIKYKNYNARFDIVASTGTHSLLLFYYWMNRTKNISFVFLDEFDAFYHYDLATYILKYINNKNEFQSILTSHNTYLITNELMRPDCYSILENGKITSFADSTKKNIRQTHNLEKMMISGEFEK